MVFAYMNQWKYTSICQDEEKLVTDFNIKNKIGFVIFLHYLC